jgi:hypothetical protein
MAMADAKLVWRSGRTGAGVRVSGAGDVDGETVTYALLVGRHGGLPQRSGMTRRAAPNGGAGPRHGGPLTCPGPMPSSVGEGDADLAGQRFSGCRGRERRRPRRPADRCRTCNGTEGGYRTRRCGLPGAGPRRRDPRPVSWPNAKALGRRDGRRGAGIVVAATGGDVGRGRAARTSLVGALDNSCPGVPIAGCPPTWCWALSLGPSTSPAGRTQSS